MNKIAISDVLVETLEIKVDKKYQHLLPKTPAQAISFNISNVNCATSNALRRAVMEECPAYAMHFDLADFSKTDPFVIFELIQSRIGLIPIDQNVAPTDTFSLNVTNTTPDMLDVKAKDLVCLSKKRPFNDTFTICTIQPYTTIIIKKIYIVKGVGVDDAKFTLGFNGVSLPLDQQPFNPYKNEGIKSSVSNPRKFKVAFKTNGNIALQKLMHLVCDSIIDMVKTLEDATVDKLYEYYILKKHRLTSTVGNLFVMKALDLYPDIKLVTFDHNTIENILIIKVIPTMDINDFRQTIIGKIVEDFKLIRSQF